jgi:hypothetical protein
MSVSENEHKPEWYGQLKSTEPVAKRTFTKEKMMAIERRRMADEKREAASDRKRRYFILAAVTACVFLIFGIVKNNENIRLVKDPVQTLAPVPTPNTENIVYADEKWKVTAQQFEQYTAYAKSKSEDLLIGMEPLDIFRWYVTATRIADYETLYALLHKGSDTSTPSKEEYLKDITQDTAGMQRSKQKWEGYWSEYRLEQTIAGDTAAIVMIPVNKPDTGENRKFFGLTRNKDGIWKANWLAMQ